MCHSESELKKLLKGHPDGPLFELDFVPLDNLLRTVDGAPSQLNNQTCTLETALPGRLWLPIVTFTPQQIFNI